MSELSIHKETFLVSFREKRRKVELKAMVSLPLPWYYQHPSPSGLHYVCSLQFALGWSVVIHCGLLFVCKSKLGLTHLTLLFLFVWTCQSGANRLMSYRYLQHNNISVSSVVICHGVFIFTVFFWLYSLRTSSLFVCLMGTAHKSVNNSLKGGGHSRANRLPRPLLVAF